MNWNELLTEIRLDEIEVTIINPVRNEPFYKKGRMTGFKSGVIGGGHYRYKNGVAMAFDSSRLRWVKKPKVQVTYSVADYGGKQHSDWIDYDNCEFNFKTNKV